LIIPLAIKFHCIKKPLCPTDPSDTNLIKSEYPAEDIIGILLDPQYFPSNGDVKYPPFL